MVAKNDSNSSTKFQSGLLLFIFPSSLVLILFGLQAKEARLQAAQVVALINARMLKGKSTPQPPFVHKLIVPEIVAGRKHQTVQITCLAQIIWAFVVVRPQNRYSRQKPYFGHNQQHRFVPGLAGRYHFRAQGQPVRYRIECLIELYGDRIRKPQPVNCKICGVEPTTRPKRL